MHNQSQTIESRKHGIHVILSMHNIGHSDGAIVSGDTFNDTLVNARYLLVIVYIIARHVIYYTALETLQTPTVMVNAMLACTIRHDSFMASDPFY